MAAERLTAPSKRVTSAGALDASVVDIAGFVVRPRADSERARYHMSVWSDPFGRQPEVSAHSAVASAPSRPTVPPSTAGGLTAILIADDRRVAVIDDASVRVGDVLRDGARVSAIQPDRVWVVEKSGRWRMLTLASRGTR